MSQYASYTEKELLQLISRGDEPAFRAIYDRYVPTMYATALSYLKSTDWAKDIVQDIFLKLWVKKEQLPAIEKFDSYLFIMTRNEIMTALRKRLDNNPVHDHYHDTLPADLLLPDAQLELQKLTSLIHRAVEQLPVQQKQVFRLTREQGLSHEEIARQMGIDKKTVSNHATRALNNLRNFLSRHGQNFLFFF